MAKYKAPMGVKKTAKKAKSRKEELARWKGPHYSTRELAVKNSRKLRLDEKIFGVTKGTLTKTQEKAAKVIQARREGEASRTASRAKGIAVRQGAKAKARRRARSVGN